MDIGGGGVAPIVYSVYEWWRILQMSYIEHTLQIYCIMRRHLIPNKLTSVKLCSYGSSVKSSDNKVSGSLSDMFTSLQNLNVKVPPSYK